MLATILADALPCSRWPSYNEVISSTSAAAAVIAYTVETQSSILIHDLNLIRCSHLYRYVSCFNSVFHEPLGEPFYYGPERMSNRFNAENRPEDFKKYKDLTFNKVREMLPSLWYYYCYDVQEAE